MIGVCRLFAKKRLLPLAIAGYLAPASSALALDWQISRGLGARALTTTVSTTSSDDESSQRSLLGLSGFVDVTGTGRRTRLGLNIGLEAQQVVGDEEEFSYQRNLELTSRSELVERFASLDTSARVSRRSIDGNPLNDGDTFLGEQTDDEVREFSISPSVSDRISDTLLYQSSYRFSVVRSSEERALGSDTHQLDARIVAASGPDGPFWTAGAEYETARFENGESAYLGLVGVGFAYRLRPTLLGSVVIGREWTRLGQEISSTEDPYYNVNLRWQPNPRWTATVGYSERAFGRRPRASVELIGRRSRVNLEWSRDSALLDGSSLFDSLDLEPDSAPSDDEIADNEILAPVEPEPLAPFVADLFSVTEEVSLSYVLTGRVSTLTVSMVYFERQDRADDIDTDGREISAEFNRRLSRRVDWTASTAVGRGRTSSEDGTEQRVNAELSIRMML